jgi:two-component system, NtrC family, response regulator HydG
LRKPSPRTVPTDRKRILCVDDLDDFCQLIAAVLNDYEVIPAHTKAEGLRKARQGRFDLYLLDYHLPDGTGLQLYFSIREFDSNTPALFVTTSDAIRNVQALEVGAVGVIAKHHITDMLPQAVNSLLNAES